MTPGRQLRVACLAAVLAAGGAIVPEAPALVASLSAEDIRRAIDEGTRAIAKEDFGEEWRVQLPRGEEILVTTPFARIAYAARRAAFKEEPLTDKQVQEQIDRGQGKLQLQVTMYGREVDFARWYQAVLRLGAREVKATFVQNERTPLKTEDGRFAARNVYVFPLEGIPAQGVVTLVVQHSIERKEILRAPLDLGKMR
jgi:hypothetical protein